MQIKDTTGAVGPAGPSLDELLEKSRKAMIEKPEVQNALAAKQASEAKAIPEAIPTIEELNKPEFLQKPAAETSAPIRVTPQQKKVREEIQEGMQSAADIGMDERAKPEEEMITRSAAPTGVTPGKGWHRIDMPSNLVFYDDVTEVFVRKLNPPSMAAIYGSIATKNYTAYLDALDEHISCDVRNLTMSDLVYFQYMLRILSYPSSPYKIPWVSRYGNQNIEIVRKLPFKITYVQMTREEYLGWVEQGIVMPTVREHEVLVTSGSDDSLSSADDWLKLHAQYVRVDGPIDKDYFNRKMEALRNAEDASIIELLEQFSTKVVHGVEESLELLDKEFKLDKAIEYLENVTQQMRNVLAELMASKDATVETTALLERIADYDEELEEMRVAKEAGEPYSPRKEVVVTRSIAATDMFPSEISS